ncbi:DUF397 domain-containing protein [Streptomyces sp. FL07-04A]|uniref:DUF397 domain-containing protein n=1 Tax=Streptomyces sp. FL07-04A TaxID=3028658 RepID=UPI00299FA79E|nr:DUF397 domain-containing protein [Streptomyces sp. FL07-04A]MDX3576182.1 DUF397 domain-containing protein [Streptomyces sp. FL07-04A]
MSITTPDDNGRPTWFTSSYSNGAGGECVECALTGDRVRVRDSKSVEGAEMVVRSGAWTSFIHAVEVDTEG